MFPELLFFLFFLLLMCDSEDRRHALHSRTQTSILNVIDGAHTDSSINTAKYCTISKTDGENNS